MTSQTRRRFLKKCTAVTGATLACSQGAVASAAPGKQPLHLATNVYPWFTFYRRENRDFNQALDDGLKAVAGSGFAGFEPIANGPQDIDKLEPLLEKHGLRMRSLYVNSELHDKQKAAASIKQVLAIARRAKKAGTRFIVTNPSPIRWGGPEDKNDAQLKVQAAALDRLGAELRAQGMTLSYHNHDAELRNAAREFHHMMVGTSPKNVTLCLDSHWIYRGAGDSAVAVFDILKLYGSRITELHLRQSVNGIWTESFGEGDIDYPALAKYLCTIGVKPHIVLEQAVEGKTPKTMNAAEAHRRGALYARKIFGAFAS